MKTSRFDHKPVVGDLNPFAPVVRDFKTGVRGKPKRETIQAQAVGQNSVAGKHFNVTVTMASCSTPDTQRALLDAVAHGERAALSKTLSKMRSKDRVAVTGILGYDIAYVRAFPATDGRKISLITDRRINMAVARVNERSTEYDLSALELNLNNDNSKSSGNLIIGLRVKVEKDNQLAFENYGSEP